MTKNTKIVIFEIFEIFEKNKKNFQIFRKISIFEKNEKKWKKKFEKVRRFQWELDFLKIESHKGKTSFLKITSFTVEKATSHTEKLLGKNWSTFWAGKGPPAFSLEKVGPFFCPNVTVSSL